MESSRAERPLPSTDRLAETLDLATAQAIERGDSTDHAPDSGSQIPQDGRPVEVVEGALDLSDETRLLLRVRLRAVAIILLSGFGAFFVRNQFLDTESAGVTLFVRIFHAVALVTQGAVIALLSERNDWSMRRLRQFEFALFSTALAFFGTLHFASTTRWIERGDTVIRNALASRTPADQETISALVQAAGRLIASVEMTVIYVMIVIILYGLFIPNTWRRAAIAVGLIFSITGLVQMSVMIRTAGRRSMVEQLATFEQISTNLLILFLSVLIAVYGTHLINALRVEAFEARRLGQYVLRGRIGGGGMGEVHLAEHKLLKRPCAIKLIRPDRAGDPVALRRFEQEVRAMARLTHWNTIEVYDYGRTEDGTFYYVMEYLRGLPLDTLVERHGPLDPGRVVYLLRQACDSLAEAHSAGMIHRDLKPANLVAAIRGGRCDVTKVLDFGLVKTAGSDQADPDADPGIDRLDVVTGTPLYMSPEQATGDPKLDLRSDLYALGAVAYYLLTGRPPHLGETPLQVMAAVAREPVTPPSQIHKTVPDDLEQVVLRCLAKDPLRRFPTAEALEQALAACSCARHWDAAAADSWWRSHEPETLARS
ncbi:serine/threonine-protein kinase [Tautonia marina]|uniref:serine/threonine-protein kinase n=1 Tax=Tautonia marina TaxID=2653855 RepID=UPI001260F5A8|nr:serine/threonine-protein kinase [Tautonia marina]